MLVEIEPGVRIPRNVVVLILLMRTYRSQAYQAPTGKDKDRQNYKTKTTIERKRFREIDR
jgi:hypothetical protein